MRKFFASILICLISFQFIFPFDLAHATVYLQIADFLCDRGIFYYKQEKYSEALFEFKKALLADSECEIAKEFLKTLAGQNMMEVSSSGLSHGVVVKSKEDIYAKIEREGSVKPVTPKYKIVVSKPVSKSTVHRVSEKESYIANSLVNTEKAFVRSHSEKSKSLDEESFLDSSSEPALSVANVAQNDKVALRQVDKNEAGEAIREFQQAIILEKKDEGLKKTKLLKKQMLSGIGTKPVLSQETVIDVDRTTEGKSFSEIETNIGERLIIKGENIARFLAVNPPMLKVLRKDNGDLLVEPQDLGVTYLHVWSGKDRKTYKFIIGQRKFEQQENSRIQEMYAQSELPESFKMSYSVGGGSFLSGNNYATLDRKSYSINYSSSLMGETPVGNFDSAVSADRTAQKTYKISGLRMGISSGHYDELKDINLRWFDFTPQFGAFGFPSADLRGVKVDAPMFDRKINYTTFWGAIPQGGFTQLSSNSGLSRTKQAWLEGLGINYRPSKFANFKTFYAHSYGPDRSQPVLTNEASGYGANFNFGNFNIGSEMASDSQHISYTTNSSLTISKVRVGLSMTEMNKKFKSLLGGDSQSGSTSGTMALDYRPTPNISISNSLSGSLDKVLGNPSRPSRPNYNSVTRTVWTIDPQTELELGYNMDDTIGTTSPAVVETKELTVRKKLFFIRQLSTFLTYSNSKSKNYLSPAQDFNNNKILTGLGFRLIGDLSFYYRKEFNFLRNKYSGDTAMPLAQEYGLNFNKKILDTPFSINNRIFYRDEENTASTLSSLAGEDRLEGESELTFRPNPDCEAFTKVRISNIWAEKEGASKHSDLDIGWGMRLLWDTGFRWQSPGGFQGYVFYDINGDGIRQSKEQGVKAVEIRGPQGKITTTDEKGYYKLSGIVGRTAVIECNLKTLPKGYSPTTSSARSLDVVFARSKRVDFGITTRCEISGIAFVDKDNNGRYDSKEELLKGVIIILDGKEKAVTNTSGEYTFRKLVPGEHILKLDLKSIPVKFIPKVPISKTVKVVDGAMFSYNIPLEAQKVKR